MFQENISYVLKGYILMSQENISYVSKKYIPCFGKISLLSRKGDSFIL